jgi:hypothetical protein
LIAGIVVTAVVVLGYMLGTRAPAPPPRPVPQAQLELWKCVACIKVPGKTWGACRTVTGKGDETGARRFARERVCKANNVPLDACEVDSLQCTKLENAEVVGARPKVRVVETDD